MSYKFAPFTPLPVLPPSKRSFEVDSGYGAPSAARATGPPRSHQGSVPRKPLSADAQRRLAGLNAATSLTASMPKSQPQQQLASTSRSPSPQAGRSNTPPKPPLSAASSSSSLRSAFSTGRTQPTTVDKAPPLPQSGRPRTSSASGYQQPSLHTASAISMTRYPSPAPTMRSQASSVGGGPAPKLHPAQALPEEGPSHYYITAHVQELRTSAPVAPKTKKRHGGFGTLFKSLGKGKSREPEPAAVPLVAFGAIHLNGKRVPVSLLLPRMYQGYLHPGSSLVQIRIKTADANTYAAMPPMPGRRLPLDQTQSVITKIKVRRGPGLVETTDKGKYLKGIGIDLPPVEPGLDASY